MKFKIGICKSGAREFGKNARATITANSFHEAALKAKKQLKPKSGQAAWATRIA